MPEYLNLIVGYLIVEEIFYKWLELRENTHAAYFGRYNNIQIEDIFLCYMTKFYRNKSLGPIL